MFPEFIEGARLQSQAMDQHDDLGSAVIGLLSLQGKGVIHKLFEQKYHLVLAQISGPDTETVILKL